MNQKIINQFINANHNTGFKAVSVAKNKIRHGEFDIKAPTADELEFEMEEVKIRLPFGVIAGKFWGPKACFLNLIFIIK